MKKLIILFVVAFVAVSANAQVKKDPPKKVMDMTMKQRAKEVSKAQKLQAVIQKQRSAVLRNMKKEKS